MSTFILIHGGMHAGWCWQYVTPLLRAAGHRVIAPDLPGMGEDRTPLHAVTLAMTGDFVAKLVRDQADQVILVGHSMGGLVIGEAAERVPGNVRGLIYVSALLVPGGMSMSQFSGTEMERAASGIRPTDDGISVVMDPLKAADVFYNTTDRAIAKRAIARLTPQPIALMNEPVTVTTKCFGSISRAYIECIYDHTIPISFQKRMQAQLPCEPVFSMETDHSPFLSSPDVLASHLSTIAQVFS